MVSSLMPSVRRRCVHSAPWVAPKLIETGASKTPPTPVPGWHWKCSPMAGERSPLLRSTLGVWIVLAATSTP